MANFAITYALVASFEGSYSNDPNDRGGETYAGIARNFFPDWQGWPHVDQCKARTGMAGLAAALAKNPELKNLVTDWYRREWWDRLGLAVLDQELANEIFEQAVNLGKAGCGKKVQTMCNAWNYGPGGKPLFADLVLDGAIGPKTLAALAVLVQRRTTQQSLVHSLNCLQGSHYLELAAKNPSQRKFTNGWMTRTHCEN